MEEDHSSSVSLDRRDNDVLQCTGCHFSISSLMIGAVCLDIYSEKIAGTDERRTLFVE